MVKIADSHVGRVKRKEEKKNQHQVRPLISEGIRQYFGWA
jgi:hypothetical protein